MTPELVLVYEPEEACRERLLARGLDSQAVLEISSYLAQSTDIAQEFEQIGAACDERGLRFTAVELDEAAAALAARRGKPALVWALTDGIAYFRGSATPALARLNGLRTIGADDALFALCQDKFRSGAVMRALGLPVPEGGLARNGRFIVDPSPSEQGWFVKPNRLGAKIGIWADSRVDTPDKALELSRRVYDLYRDDVVVQPYVAGRNGRGSYLAVEPGAGMDAMEIALVDSGGDFQTMAESMTLYGETGTEARDAGTYAEPRLSRLQDLRPEADRRARMIAGRMMDGLGLSDVFSFDLRVADDDTVHLIEFEVCPGLPCFDFRAYCASRWGLSLAEAMAATAAARLRT